MDRGLLKYCTAREREYLELLVEGLNQRAVATKFGVSRCAVKNAVKRVKVRAASQGYSPEHGMTKTVPDGFNVKGVSTMYNAEGEITAQWVKSSEDQARQRIIAESAYKALAEELPRYAPLPPPKFTLSNLCNQYTITDYHLGMLAWGEETGADWDLEIAENMLLSWFAAAIDRAPLAEQAIFAQIGDFFHWDGMEAVTPSHGHILDADTRYQKLVRVAIRCVRKIIDMLLEKHKSVHVVFATGNHDLSSSVFMREWIAAAYEQEARLTVDCNPDVYYGYKWGNCGLFYHHGHKRKPESIDKVFAAKFREIMFGCEHIEAHMGHFHHDKLVETELMSVYQHRTLAAPDAHAALGGWISKRSAQVVTYHRDHGRVASTVINPAMLSE